MADIHLSRKELYDQVWKTSMVKLAKQYGLSDVGLAKICKKHNIPRPTLGYWAKKYAGHNVHPIPLPAGDDVTIVISPNPYNQNNLKSRNTSFDKHPYKLNNEPITVPDRLSDPHPLIRQSSEILNASKVDEFGIITPSKKGCLDIKVSTDSLRRALRIMDTVIKVLEKQGYKVYLSEGHTKVEILDAVILFGIKEKLIKKEKRPAEHNLKGRYEFGHSFLLESREPSGDLGLIIHDVENFYADRCRKTWNDGVKSKLESHIGSFIEGLVTVAMAKKERDREREEERLRQIERQRQIEANRQMMADLRKRYLEEKKRVTGLISDAENWKRSKTVREFIEEVKIRAGSGVLIDLQEKPMEDWLKWACDQADRLDPFTESPPSILDQECPTQEAIDNYPYTRVR
jgi:hypothetical protein